MDERTFQLWAMYFREEPFGPGVLNDMLARVAAAAAKCPDYEAFLPIARQAEDDDG
jgi:hypothetical protein